MRPRVLVACALVAVAALAAADLAWGCSCAARPDRERLREAEAAFVGVVQSRRPAEPERPDGSQSSADPFVVTMRVEEVFKNDFEETVEVWTVRDGASCGMEAAEGSRIGLFPYWREGRWHGNLCGQIDPEDLRQAAREEGLPGRPPRGQPSENPGTPPPPPPTAGEGALLLAGARPASRLVLLDGRGRILARRAGRERVMDLSPCPGGRLVLDLMRRRGRQHLVTRSLPDLRTVRSERVPAFEPDVVRCLDASGGAVVRAQDRRARWRPSLLRRDAAGWRTVFAGRANLVWPGPRDALLIEGRDERVLAIADYQGGRAPLVRLARPGAFWFPSADGTRLAATTWTERGRRPPTAMLIDRRTQPPAVRRRALSDLAAPHFLVAWDGDDRVAMLPGRGGSGRGVVLDAELRPLATVSGWRAHLAAVLGDDVYGLTGGALVRAPLAGGRTRAVRRLPHRSTLGPLAAVPPAPAARAAGRSPCPFAR